ncbi:MAG: ankyrin repeat domain-containing protein [Alphaproteobacteria bacterium]|nr:ankyrin repeat domain-containing protein [Alphaproteobacteria bacterium]
MPNHDLLDAVRKNDYQRALHAVCMGASVNARDGYDTALDIAIENNNPKMVFLLIDEEDDKMDHNSLECGLYTAMCEGKREISRMIATHMENTTTHPTFDKTYVVMAIEKNWPDVLEALAQRGAPLEKGENRGVDPLRLAARLNRGDCIRAMGRRFEDVDKFENELTPLQLAALKGNDDAVGALIDIGAEINTTYSTLGDSVKILAMFSTAFLYIPNLPSRNNAVHYAAQSNNPKTIETIAEKCASVFHVNSVGTNDKSPLMQAIERGAEKTAKVLLEYGADPNLKDKYTSPLHVAVRLNRPDLIQLLFNYGADQKVKNSQGQTPFEYAVRLNSVDCIPLLSQAWTSGKPIVTQKPYYRPQKGKDRDERS